MELFKEIVKEGELKYCLYDTVDEIADVVTSTMGPYGNTVILTNKFEGPYATKDGVSVIKAIGYKNTAKNTIAQLLKEVAEKTLKTAGDGTTTAICLAQAILKEGKRRLERGATYVEILKELNELEKHTLTMLDDMSEDLVKENILDVATISANGDITMGKVIEDAFKHSTNVKVELGTDSYDTIEKVNGMILDTGYLDSALVNIPEKDSIIYDKPKVIIIDGKLVDLKIIGGILESVEGPFIIIADEVSPNVQTIIRDNYNRGALTVGLMKTPGFGGHRKNLVKDLEYFTDAVAVKHNTTTVGYGTVDSIVIGRDKTIVTKKKLSKVCQQHATNLGSLLKDRPEDDLLKLRIENLVGSMSIIKVGGISNVEVNEKFDRYDDAVRAVGCALEEGIIPGGGQALALLNGRFQEFMKENTFLDVLVAPMNKIEKNSNYNLQIEGRDMMIEKIFDPTKVTKTAFINAMSVSKALLNTSNLILDRTLWS